MGNVVRNTDGTNSQSICMVARFVKWKKTQLSLDRNDRVIFSCLTNWCRLQKDDSNIKSMFLLFIFTLSSD